MAYGRREGFSYADDIPLKIIDRMKIPPSLILPININNHSPNLLGHDYDFSLERKVIELDEIRCRLKEESARAKAAALEMERLTLSEIEEEKKRRAVPLTWKTNQILSPQPLQEKMPQGVANTKAGLNGPLNLSDFESQGSSPFDFIELQTLNDIEELNTVFQGMPLLRDSQINDVQERTDEGNSGSVDGVPPVVVPAVTDLVASTGAYDALQTLPVNAYSNSTNLLQENSVPVKEDSSKSLTSDSQWLANSRLLNSPAEALASENHKCLQSVKSDESNFPQSQNSESFSPLTQKSDSSKADPVVDSFPSNLQKLNQNGVQTPEERLNRETRLLGANGTLPRLRGSNSSPNVSVERDEVAGWRSATPPPALQRHETNAAEIFLPNPYDELDSGQKEFVDSLVDMGFAKDRAARAVKHLGTDNKKVLDHLCQVQGLEEGGHSGMDAETALHLYDYNVQEAKEYLELLNQFQDLGFQKCDIRKALIRHKNDRDKTLDFLLS